MDATFEVSFTGVLPATPPEAWAALTTNTGAWIWPISYEPHVGGKADGIEGTLTEWQPHERFINHAERPDGWFNTLTHQLTPVEGGTLLEYTHRGVHEGDYDTEQAACSTHTAVYFHTLTEYLAHFKGRPATYISADATESGRSYADTLAAFDLTDAQVDDKVHFTAPDGTVFDGVVDYRTENFIGIRTADSMLRILGRDTWGWPIGIAWHVFTQDVDADAATAAWTRWLG